jgi:hypothetical protein
MTNYLDYTNAVAAMQAVVSDASISSAFNQGLYFGCVVMACCIGFMMLRRGVAGDREES